MKLCRKQTCIQCHFFMKQAASTKLHVTASDRADIIRGDFSWAANYSLGCYLGVWDEGYGLHGPSRSETILAMDRRSFCFFWPFRPGLFFPAGELLQKREAQARQAKVDRRLTIVGLWIASLALLADVIISLLLRGSS